MEQIAFAINNKIDGGCTNELSLNFAQSRQDAKGRTISWRLCASARGFSTLADNLFADPIDGNGRYNKASKSSSKEV